MFGLGMGEIIVILVIALIFIGPKKLPELAAGLGKGLKEFQNAMKGLTNPESSNNNPVNDERSKSAGEKITSNEESSQAQTEVNAQSNPEVPKEEDQKHS